MARKKGPQVDQAYEYIKNKILTFELAPGTEISDHKLEQNLEMSRSPIREAIMRLIADGLVENANGRTSLSPMNLQDIVEICQVRKAIEIAAIEILIAQGGPSDHQLKELAAMIERMHKDDNLTENYELDDQFHNLIMEAAANGRMIDIANKMRLQISRARWLNIFFPNRLSLATIEHEAIFQGLKERSCEKSVEAMAKHLDNSAKNFELVLNNPSFNPQFLRGIATLVAGSNPK